MKNLFEIAISVVSESRRLKCDPMMVGSKIARQIGLCSSDAEALLMQIWLVRKYGVDEEPQSIEEAREVMGAKEYERVRDIVAATA